jgi:hypothetical protein
MNPAQQLTQVLSYMQLPNGGVSCCTRNYLLELQDEGSISNEIRQDMHERPLSSSTSDDHHQKQHSQQVCLQKIYGVESSIQRTTYIKLTLTSPPSQNLASCMPPIN